MKILHITPEAPGYYSGGRLGVLQTKESIVCNGNIVDYVGPYIENPEISDGYNNLYFLDKSNNAFKLIFNLANGITNKSYDSWKKLDLDCSKYDYIVLDFTKLDYVLKKIDSDKLLVRVHNVEYDFSNCAFKVNRNLKNFLVKSFAYRQESQIVECAKKLFVLTDNDKERLVDLYNIDHKKISIIPVCTREISSFNSCNDKVMIITGSLWFGGNLEGIKWFINNVFVNLDDSFRLIIAGNNPNEEIKRIINNHHNIELVENPIDMGAYFSRASIAIAPVFEGAGMKVKVAEALSYGLPVIATNHALIGYHIDNGVNSFCANSPEEFLNAINIYFSFDNKLRNIIKNNALKLHRESYSIKQSKELWGDVFNE